MNQVISNILSRRTTRKFTSEAINPEMISAIVEAGIYAPSGHNAQPWHFTVIRNPELLKELNLATKEEAKNYPDPTVQKMANNEGFNLFYNAPVLIVVSGMKTGAVMMRDDCAAATQNMLLAAESLGLGACWNGMMAFLFNSPKGAEYTEKLGIPENYTPLYAVALGHKAVSVSAAPARKANLVNYID
jgi:nitroreductase